jgi:beta-mannosidase
MTPPARLSSTMLHALSRFVLISTKPGAHASPSQVDFSAGRAFPVPGTLAGVLAAAGEVDLARPPALEAQDHWFRTELPELPPGCGHTLVCEGLASVVEVWLDDLRIGESRSMFVPLEVRLPANVRPGASLTFCARALKAELQKRRPRPRYRTRIVADQQLRYLRTSLVGRTSGFCPEVPVVGPYRAVRIESHGALRLCAARVRSQLGPDAGWVDVSVELEGELREAELEVAGDAGHGSSSAACSVREGRTLVAGRVRIADPAQWWPHTHGAQPLSHVRLRLPDGVTLELGRVGFRSLVVDRTTDGTGFGLVVNGVPVFCRGAVYTTGDLLRVDGDDVPRTLGAARAAGMNMLRVAGIGTYPDAAFYALCDELGILVFQDFMFANLDYPVGDAAFLAEVRAEARHLVGVLGQHPCLTVLCGGSEVEQQMAMLGLAEDERQNALFSEHLPTICAELAPDVPYVPSSPSGGGLPFHVDAGVGHYFGVGAYLRPLDDARRSHVRFASECLAFANIPARETIEHFMRDLEMPFHHPRWKERVPRDRGAGWDFEDVRDHYLKLLFQVEPRTLRYADSERYLALSNAAVGEAMLATFSEWRRPESSCRGGLVLWLRDLWAGAGWGVIDALGRPKSAYYYLARAMAPQALLLTDEGLNGLHLHLLNERATPLATRVGVALYRDGEVLVERAECDVHIAARGAHRTSVEELLGHFCDPTYAYRFGPPGFDLVVAHITNAAGEQLDAFHLPLGALRPVERELGLTAHFKDKDGAPGVLVSTRKFAQCVALDVPGYLPEDDYFHLAPGRSRFIPLRPHGPKGPARGTLGAINLAGHVHIGEGRPEAR